MFESATPLLWFAFFVSMLFCVVRDDYDGFGCWTGKRGKDVGQESVVRMMQNIVRPAPLDKDNYGELS